MSFVSPLLLLALALLVPVAIAFLHRERRPAIRVPSTMLHKRLALSVTRSKRFRDVARWLALLACLVAVGALVLAASGPRSTGKGRTLALVVDVSASMGDRAEDPLGKAREFVREAVRARASSDRIAIILAGEQPLHLAGPTGDGAALDDALRHIASGHGSSNTRAAVELASALIRHQPSPRVVLLTDGGASLGAGIDPASLHVPLTERRFDHAQLDNLGISALATRPRRDARSDDDREVLVTVASSSNRPRHAKVTLSADGVTLEAREVTIPTGETAELRFGLRASPRALVARIEPSDGAPESIHTDDLAALATRSAPHPRVLLVGSGQADHAETFFTDRALSAAGIDEIVRVTPSEAQRVVRDGDVVVVLRDAPSTRLTAPTLYLATRAGTLPVRDVHALPAGATQVRSVDPRDPLVRGVQLDELRIEDGLAFTAPDGSRTLVELDGGPVLAAGGAGRNAWVYSGLDPRGSDLVLRVAFPVLIANALAELTGASKVDVAQTVPREEITRMAREERLDPEPSVPWSLPVDAPLALSLVAIAALLGEAFAYKKGWIGA